MTSEGLGAADVVGCQPGTNRRGEQALRQAPPARDTSTTISFRRGRNQYKLFCAPVCVKDILTLLPVILSSSAPHPLFPPSTSPPTPSPFVPSPGFHFSISHLIAAFPLLPFLRVPYLLQQFALRYYINLSLRLSSEL